MEEKRFNLEQELEFDASNAILIDLSISSWSFRETKEGLKIVVRRKNEIEKQKFEQETMKSVSSD